MEIFDLKEQENNFVIITSIFIEDYLGASQISFFIFKLEE